VKILRNNLTDATSFAFKITVPGATTGPVPVVTPSGTLTSSANFQVEP
jgi:hypothetical protein